MPYPEFIESCEQLVSRLAETNNPNESQTRTWFIDPFLGSLGYDTSNPTIVVPEYEASFANATGETVDYALLDNNKRPMILIEAKRLNTTLDIGDARQLSSYFNNTEARVGILTNGIIYEVYLDKERENVMDGRPFFTFNLASEDDLGRRTIFRLARLEDGSLDRDTFEQAVREWRITTKVKPGAIQVFQRWYDGSADDLSRLLTDRLMVASDEDTLGNMAADWFKEFVDSKSIVPLPPHRCETCGGIPPQPQCETCGQEPRPFPDEISLTRWQIGESADMPHEIIFPDGTTAPIRAALDVPLETTRWLRTKSHLSDNSLPIRTGRDGRGRRYLVALTEQLEAGPPMTARREVAVPAQLTVYVESTFNASSHVQNAVAIIKHAGQDPEKFRGRWRA